MLKKNINKIAFVILHYLSLNDTKKCIESIMALESNDVDLEIVVVDNASYNGTGEDLEQLYEEDNKVHILRLEKNLGFANGNNVGFRFAKHKLESDFIVMINNDTEIRQSDFIKRMIRVYKERRFAVLGPKILLRNNKINTVYGDLLTIKHYKKDLRILKIEYIMSVIGMYAFYVRMKATYRLLKTKFRKKHINSTKQLSPNEWHYNIVLHGCALIFSKDYISKFDGLDKRTFLYREEELLFLRLKEYNLRSIYCPELIIYHDEDGATNAMMGTARRKRIFVYKNMIKSTKLLIDDLTRRGYA